MTRIFRFIILILTICVSAALFITYLTYYIDPRELSFFEIWALGYPIYMSLAFVSIIYWLFSDIKKYVFIPLISIVFGMSTHLDVIAFNKSVEPSSDNTLSVVTYNVQAFNWLGWRQRKDIQQGVCEYLYEKQADVLCFQEFHHDIREAFVVIDSLKKHAGVTNIAAYQFHAIPGRYFYGNVICSRFPIIRHDVLQFQKTGNSCLWADIKKGTDTIRICNVHFESYRFSPNQIETINKMSFYHIEEPEEYRSLFDNFSHAIFLRAHQAEELAQFIVKSPYKVVVTGDFNTPPYSHTYRTVQKAADFSDAFLSAGSGIGGTLNWKLSAIRLDYVLYPNNWKAFRYESPQLLLSDHFPVYTEISVE
ncbi:MAG: endonuclease/exonuclease/phosphatase family protein [Bacteroidota bacterium]